MVRVLIVEDSPMECQFMAPLLEKRPEWILSFASNGSEALHIIARQQPDVVLSDLKMPGMDGLELLEAIRERFSQIPVVILTVPGSEEIAMEALRSGAASYVAKKSRADQLISVLEMVLAANGRRRNHHQLLDSLTLKHVEFVVPNDRRLIPALINYLQEAGVRLGVFGEADRTRIGVALEEALLNALVHGNLEVGSELKLQNDGAYEKLIALRREKDPYCDRKLTINARLTPAEAQFTIRDEGPGFDVAAVPDPTILENLEKPSGRGLLLMRAFLDEVRHNDKGNEVTLIKRRTPAPHFTPWALKNRALRE
jgi:CheY-like chemotaxis protein/anti-sigma regulatory factor (Ser/Thr protein kinase)